MTDEEIKKARAAKNAYQRQWRRENPDKVREQTLRHWLKKAQALERHERDGGDVDGCSE